MNQNRTLTPAGFDALADWLLTIGSDFSPAELHGAIVGGMSGAMRLSAGEWTAFVIAVLGVDGRLSATERETAQKVIGGMAEAQLSLLADNNNVFSPFLPGDDIAIALRTEALGSWCKGFLGGFAEAQVFCQRGETEQHAAPAQREPSNLALSANVREALQDISAIAQASLDGDADSDDGDSHYDGMSDDELPDVLSPDGIFDTELEDESERDYFEVVEYLRLAALTVFTEYGWVEAQGQSMPVVGGKVETDNGIKHTLH